MNYAINWDAGGSAQIELSAPREGEKDAEASFQMKFISPFRQAVRPSPIDINLDPEDVRPINEDLQRLNGLAIAPRGAAAPNEAANPAIELCESIGDMMYRLVIPNDIHGELASEDVLLDFVIDESLIKFPWELMHDGEDFLSLKYGMGRFVNNASKGAISPAAPLPPFSAGPLSVLLISVPQPIERDGKTFAKLDAAEAETKAIAAELIKLRPDIQLETMTGNDSTFDGVRNRLRNGRRAHIVHFNGHAEFDPERPRSSALVLQDKNMTMAFLKAFFGQKPPALFFMNACETAATPADAGAGANLNPNHVFGLARPFLETGAYLIGTRWKVGDQGAKAFAAAFYSQLKEGKPLGKMIRDARRACRDPNCPDDLTWASYVYYGDPRLCFRKVPQVQAGPVPATGPAAQVAEPAQAAEQAPVAALPPLPEPPAQHPAGG
jgi:hypothetical protein